MIVCMCSYINNILAGIYSAPKGTWCWGGKIIWKEKLFFNAFVLPEKHCALFTKVLWSLKKHCVLWANAKLEIIIRWEEELYFSAFVRESNVSWGSAALLQNSKSFANECKVSRGMQHFCEITHFCERMQFLGDHKTCKITFLWVNANFLESTKPLQDNTFLQANANFLESTKLAKKILRANFQRPHV